MLPAKVTASVDVPLHFVWSAGLVTVGVGLTVMVKGTGVPSQPLILGVTVIVPVIVAVPVLVAENEVILPVPPAANPIAVLEFVQSYVTPLPILPVKSIAPVDTPLHLVRLESGSTVGVGLTVMVKETGVPSQSLIFGVTVIVPVIGEVPVLVAVNEPILPVPVAANPMDGVLFIQL